MEKHKTYMQRCIELAKNGAGSVAPNPMVGCVIVKDDLVIGEGFHRQHGGPHAEINAIQSVQDDSQLKNATLYVNLEPCSHFGKTPPCAQAILDAGISDVVISSTDPNQKVMGKGIEMLRSGRVEVTTDVLLEEEQRLNKRFRTYHWHKRPYIILKWAQSKDGFMDIERGDGQTGQHKISGPEAKRLVHYWRSIEDAILVGAQTVINDDPALTVREVNGKNPLRLILDPNNRIPDASIVLNDGNPTLIYNTSRSLKNGSVEYIEVRSDQFLEGVFTDLYNREIQSVLVEGGSKTLQAFLDHTWDEARILQSDANLEKGLAAPEMKTEVGELTEVGKDQLSVYFNKA